MTQVARENPFQRYDPRLDNLASYLVFDTQTLGTTTVLDAVEQTRKMPGANLGDGLDEVQEVFLGIAAHEAAEQAFEAWNAQLTKYRNPEDLTREEVSQLFEASPYGKMLKKHEQAAIGHFSNLLEKNNQFAVSTSENTGFDAADISTYLIDLKNRVAERINDPEERGAALEELDEELAELIKNLPEGAWGKKLELQELYLLRRLIHRADTGHIAHVSHGTLRQDLRADMGSVDLRLTVAGDIYDFQIKTFKESVSDVAKARQYDTVIKNQRRFENSTTHFAILQTDRVQAAYDRSQRQKTADNQTVGDKFAALQPLTNDLTERERARLVKTVGLTEETLAKEQEAFDQQQARMNEHLQEVRAKAAAEQAKFDEAVALRKQRAAEEEERVLAAIRAQFEHEESQRIASAEQRRKEAEQQSENQAKREEKKAKEKALAKQLENERAAAEEAARKAEEKKIKTKASKEQAKEIDAWVKQHSTALLRPDALIKAGFLDSESRGDIPKILAAKKVAEQRYTKKYILTHYPFGSGSQEIEIPAAE